MGGGDGGRGPRPHEATGAPVTTLAQVLDPGEEPQHTIPPGVPDDTRPWDDQGNRIGPAQRGGVVRGQAVDAAGAPIPGLCAAIEAPVPAGDIVTGPDGRWSVDLPDGQRTTVLSVRYRDCTGAVPGWLAADTFPWVEVRTTQVVELPPAVVERSGALDVTVLDRSGAPLSGACVAWNAAEPPVTTGAGGRALLDDLPPGEVQVMLDSTCAGTGGDGITVTAVVGGEVRPVVVTVGQAVGLPDSTG